MPVQLDFDACLQRMLSLPRPGAGNVLAFYEYRLDAICRDPRLMLIPLDDHLVHRGDGVFETLKYLDGKLYQLDAHIERMQRSAKAIGLAAPCAWSTVRDVAIEVARAGGEQQGLLRLLLGRGAGGFGIDPFECPTPSLHIVAYRFQPKPEAFFERGATAFRSGIPAKQSYMAQIKSIDYLPNMLMKREALERNIDFAVSFDEHGNMAEGCTENVCIVDQSGTLVVPEMTNALRGTTLMRALDLIAGELDVTFRGIREDEIFLAREFIAVGTTLDAVGLVRFNGKPIHDVRPGPVTRRMRTLLQEDLRQNGTPVFP